MTPTTPFAEKTRLVANRIGGVTGRSLAAAVDEMLSATPELGTRTTSPISSQLGNALLALGRYSPGTVPIRTKKLMRKDAQIRLTLEAAKAPILKAPLWFETRSTEIQSLLTDVFIESGFLHETLRTGLLAIEFGFSAHEKVWDIETDHEVRWDVPNTTGGMDSRGKVYPSLFVPECAKSLDPEYVTLLQDEYGTFKGLIYGITAGELSTGADIDALVARGTLNALNAEKSFVFALNDEWQNQYGEGCLDYAYDPWYWQQLIYLVTNRWFERKSDPPILGWAPATPALGGPDIESDDSATYEDAAQESPLVLHARGLRRLRSSGLYVMPAEPFLDDAGKPSNLRCYDAKEMAVADMSDVFISYLEHLDRRKSRAMLVPDSVVAGQQGSGTYGSLQILAEITVDIQNARLQQFLNFANEAWIEPFLEYNGIKEKALLRTGGISSNNREVLRDITIKILEADMLAEQAWGRIFPQSLTSMISRDDLLRALAVPYKQPDPDSPLPRPPMSPQTPTADAQAGRDKVSNQTPNGKTNPGGGRAAAADLPVDEVPAETDERLLALTESEYVQRKIPVLKREHSDWADNQVVAVAHAMYRKARANPN
jgi:hypothetical protein